MPRFLVSLLVALFLLPAPAALAHKERPIESPPRPGSVPDQTREPTQVLDVCKTGECAYEHIQAAVNAATDGALIRIWPGTYHEEPSVASPDLPADNPDGTFSYDFHVANPNAQNLIAIVGLKNITLRGMGAEARDVVIDGAFNKHVVIRGDRADGLIIENVSVWHGLEHGIYILDTDGFVIDQVHSGYSRDYPFLTFANDHGLMKNCEAFGGGDGGIYPGGSAETPGRFSMEVTRCRSYHNVLGYSGTQGNHVWVHDNEFFGNAVGLVSDSETDHPNYPQEHLVFERNKVYNNNFNPYLETSDVEATVFANFAFIPVGTGVSSSVVTRTRSSRTSSGATTATVCGSVPVTD
ncbi:MAG: right-handed parallel beta-helix repeat-containing protein [Actinomycetota bacterium]